MLRNYLLIALRVLNKNTLFSAINILGLSIGLGAAIIIYLWVYDEVSYDKFHENSGRIYRVERDMVLDDGRLVVPITSPVIGPQMMEDYAGVEAFVRYAYDNVLVEDIHRNQNQERIFYADSSFFNVFSFDILEGSASTCLSEPFSVAVSASYAKKYFGGFPEPGSVLNINYNGQIRPYTVTAVFENFPHNSHIQAEMIGSFSSLYSLRHEMMMKSWMASFHYTYIMLEEGADAKEIEAGIQEMVDKYFGPEFRNFLEFDDPRDFLKLKLIPLTDIHLNANRIWEIQPPGSKSSVLVFSLVAILLLLIAGINFMNLSSARASRRALEVGIRKTAGATKGQLVWQFLGESVLLSFLALVLSLLVIEVAFPYFTVFTGKNITTSIIIRDWNLPVIILAWLVTALLAGAYPAFFLSTYKPVDVLKGRRGTNGSRLFRKILVTGQFAVSVGLIVCALSVYRQIQYINSKDLGYNRHGLINIPVENRANFESFDAVKQDLLKIPEVVSVTRSMVIPTDLNYTDNPHVLRSRPDTFFPIINRVDDQFINTFGIRLIAGSGFTAGMVSDTSVYYIINDAARRMFGFDAPLDALGEEIGLLTGQNGETRDWGQIIGVCEDFHFQPLTEIIKPMVISSSSASHRHITIRVDEGNMARANQLIGEVWEEHFPEQLYISTFVSQNFEKQHLTESRLQVILLIFTALSIFVACLGLFGLSAFEAEQRIKEIGIRKTLGAEVYQIILMVSSEFSRLVLISCLIAMPVAYYILREWVNNFPYRRDMELWVFLGAALTGWLTAFLTVLVITYRAARTNPVDTLKYE